MSEVPPLPLIASQGGWADRFFAQPDTKHVGNNGTPVSMTQAFPAPMIRSDISYGGSAQPLQVVNQSSAAGGPVRRLAPFIRVETPSNRSSMTSTTDSTASLAHAASVDLNRTAAKQAVLQTLAQSHRPPSSGLQYGSSYAAPPPLGPLPQPPTQLASSPIPTVPAPNSLHTHTPAGSHLSAPFEYDRDRNTQRQSVTDTASVYSRSSTAFEPHMTARRSLVQRSDTLGRAMVRDAMGGQAYGQEQPQMSGGFGNGMPRAL